MRSARPPHYSALQILLHWSVAALVSYQYLFHDGVMAAWHFYTHGNAVRPDQLSGATIHITIGLIVLALAVVRLSVRVVRGVPALPQSEPPLMRMAATATHHALYALIFLVPLSGAAAWFLLIERAATVHNLAKLLLLVVVALHIAGALVQALVFRSNVLTRMLSPRH